AGSPHVIAVVFDAPGRTFRDALFESYKAQRSPMPDDLRAQLQPPLDCVEARGLPLTRNEGDEADDVMWPLAEREARDGVDVLISAGDKDMAQLVTERITLVNTRTGSRLDRAGVKAKFDVWPEQIVDYLALVGDSSDNIPGVAKVGPKTAAKWLNEFGNLERLVENAASISGKVGESLRASLKDLDLSRRLATLDCEVPLDLAPQSLVRREADRERLRELYTRLEFRAFLRQLSEDAATASSEMDTASPTPDHPPRNYECVTTLDALQRWLNRLQDAELISFHTQTSSPDYMQAQIVGVAFAVKPHEAAYVPLAHDYPGAPRQLPLDAVPQALKPVLESESPCKAGHYLKHDAHVLGRAGVELRGLRFDAMLESYVLNSTATRHDLDAIARKHLGLETIRYEDVAGKGARQIPFSQIAFEQATAYAAEIADVALQAHSTLWRAITREPTLQKLYEEIEQPLAPVLLRMERTGVLIDGALLRRQSAELAERMREIEARAHQAAGGPFALESPKQLQEILFGKLGL